LADQTLYNSHRIHQTFGFRSRWEFEEQHQAKLAVKNSSSVHSKWATAILTQSRSSA
jgi:hypothetical protein